MIQRGSALGRGTWSLPGGKLNEGETAWQAAHRELLEETGVRAKLVHEVGLFEVAVGDLRYAITCFAGTHLDGEATAGSDAMDARWVHYEAISHLDLAPNILQAVMLARNLTSV